MSEKKEPKKSGDDKPEQETLKTCFVIMPISGGEPYAPGHFDRVFDHIIDPACRKAGFNPFPAHRIKAANYIIIDILDQLLKADMVVCDVSSRNPNVMYELGFRQAFDLPVTLLRDNNTDDIFDIQGLRYVRYDHHLRIDLVAQAVKELADAITDTYTNKDKGVFSLVRILGWDKAQLKSSSITDETKIILEAINELRSTSVRSSSRSGIVSLTFDNHTMPVNPPSGDGWYKYELELKPNNTDPFEILLQKIGAFTPNAFGPWISINEVNNRRTLHLYLPTYMPTKVQHSFIRALDATAIDISLVR